MDPEGWRSKLEEMDAGSPAMLQDRRRSSYHGRSAQLAALPRGRQEGQGGCRSQGLRSQKTANTERRAWTSSSKQEGASLRFPKRKLTVGHLGGSVGYVSAFGLGHNPRIQG